MRETIVVQNVYEVGSPAPPLDSLGYRALASRRHILGRIVNETTRAVPFGATPPRNPKATTILDQADEPRPHRVRFDVTGYLDENFFRRVARAANNAGGSILMFEGATIGFDSILDHLKVHARAEVAFAQVPTTTIADELSKLARGDDYFLVVEPGYAGRHIGNMNQPWKSDQIPADIRGGVALAAPDRRVLGVADASPDRRGALADMLDVVHFLDGLVYRVVGHALDHTFAQTMLISGRESSISRIRFALAADRRFSVQFFDVVAPEPAHGQQFVDVVTLHDPAVVMAPKVYDGLGMPLIDAFESVRYADFGNGKEARLTFALPPKVTVESVQKTWKSSPVLLDLADPPTPTSAADNPSYFPRSFSPFSTHASTVNGA